MKKFISIIVVLCLLILPLCSCTYTPNNDDGKIKVMSTIFPIYDWVQNIVGNSSDTIETELLVDNGVDLHSFQPTADDIISISTCDVFVYVGGESDEWIDEVLSEAVNKDMVVINLMEILGNSAKEEEIIEGMQGEDEEGDKDEIEYDEHIWLSLKNAENICQAIEQELEKVDEKSATVYEKNTENYISKLSQLDNEYSEAIGNSKNKTLLFADRFPFRYLIDDYNLNYYAAFIGCSAESEAGFNTITFLANKIDTLNLKYVLTTESSDGRIAQTVILATKSKNAQILTLDSMQSVTQKQIKNGISYIEIMQKNLTVIKTVLEEN